MEYIKLISEVCQKQGWQHDGPDITLSFGDNRKQRVQTEIFLFEGEEMIRIYTRVGPLNKLTETQLSALLGLNFSLTFGALASFGEDLVMTETLLVRDAVQDHLAYAVRFLAETSDGYEKQIYGTDRY
tara:strand:+ start:203577 stop:203960 length:384 start_codon:yes stop_codon:yes gene_type:complete